MQKEQIIAVVVIVAFLGIVGFVFFTSQKKEEITPQASQNESSIASVTNSSTEETMKAPKMQIDVTKSYTAVMKTSEGSITLELNAKETLVTVNNFVFLAKKNFYNNTIFHRVIKGFMIQGGDPKGTGSGGPGYQFDDEKFTGEYTKGTLAMANAGPNTNGSQFFIMHGDTPLPKNYTIFGKVTEGLDVVDKIAQAPTVQDGAENSTPVSPVKVLSVEIAEK